jgi:hypothetical protein
MARMTINGVTLAVIASLMLGSFASEADDLQALNEAAGRLPYCYQSSSWHFGGCGLF